MGLRHLWYRWIKHPSRDNGPIVMSFDNRSINPIDIARSSEGHAMLTQLHRHRDYISALVHGPRSPSTQQRLRLVVPEDRKIS